ncbi:hypothetical protein NUSPORA_02066 [Nucleospora cyclopteri]
MLFFGKKNNTNALQGGYPTRKYIQVMCTRKHCTEACENKNDLYKFWSLLLAGSEINQPDLIKYIKNIPEKLRFAVYVKLTGKLRNVDKNEYTNYIKAASNTAKGLFSLKKAKLPSESEIQESNYVQPDGTYILMAIKRDKELLDDIFRFCEKNKILDGEEDVFNIYKKLGKDYKINKEILNLICRIKTMPLSNIDGIYTIIDHLYRYCGLEEFVDVDESLMITFEPENTNNDESIELDVGNKKLLVNKAEEFKNLEYKMEECSNEEKEDSTDSFSSNSLEKNIKKNEQLNNNESYNELFDESSTIKTYKKIEKKTKKNEQLNNNESYNELFDESSTIKTYKKIEKKTKKNEQLNNNESYNELFDESSTIKTYKKIEGTVEPDIKYKEIFKIILKFDFSTFITITDIAVTTNLTYKEVILRAAEFSDSNTSDSIIKVLAARSNFKYYTPIPRKDPVEPERMKTTYFDFLLIQNELIKAQENIRSSLIKENENLKLKIDKLEIKKE